MSIVVLSVCDVRRLRLDQHGGLRGSCLADFAMVNESDNNNETRGVAGLTEVVVGEGILFHVFVAGTFVFGRAW